MDDGAGLRAIILAAGEGIRLRPYTLDRPKCLVAIDGKTLLDRQLAVLAAESVQDIVVIGGYRSEMLKRSGIKLRTNPRFAETNMVWTLFCAEDDLDRDVLICYGDIVYSREVLRQVTACDADIAVAIDLDWESYWRARNENPLDDAETLKLRPDGSICEIGQRPRSLEEIQGQYMGLIRLTRHGIQIFKKVFSDARLDSKLLGKPVEKAFMTDLLQAIALSGDPVHSIPVRGGWVEVDSVGDLLSPITRKRLASIEASVGGPSI